jgi:hypothetical protein
MKLFKYLIIGLLFISCNEGLVQTPVDIESIEKLNYSTFSVNAYSPEFINDSYDNIVDVKIIKDSLRSSPKRNIFHGIIKRLDLDSMQRTLASIYLKKHEDCIKSCLSSIKLEERKILDSAKVVRESIKTQLDSGLISRLEARTKMTELNRTIKMNIVALNDKFKVKDCMESCDKEFISSFSEILNPEQLKRFNDWLFHNKLSKEKKRG